MFGFSKSKKQADKKESTEEAPVTKKKPSLISRLSQGLKKTRDQLSSGLGNLFLGKKEIDDALLEELETALLVADVGIDVTQTIIDELTSQTNRKALKDPAALLSQLKKLLLDILKPCEQPLTLGAKPFVILMVGINGAGKTTTIAKLCHRFQQQDKNVILAAGDTFRAAAIEQLQAWGERNHVPVISQHNGADSASVIFDAMQAANARNYDILIADTAGRLHTQKNLMDELAKIKRVIKKINDEAPHETLLVLDASLGQNGLSQAIQFHKAIGISGLCLTKLDGTAKGGIIFAIADKLKLPIRFIGIGEKVSDLKPFHAEEFIESIFEGIGEEN